MLQTIVSRSRHLLPPPFRDRLARGLAALAPDQRAAGRTALAAFSLRVAGAGVAYVSQILLARWMGVFDYGVFVLVYVWLTILSQIGHLGFSGSVIRFIPEYRARGEIDRLRGVLLASRLVAVAFATLLAGSGAALLLVFPAIVDAPYWIPLLLGAVCLPLFCLTEVQDGIARSFDWPGLAFGPSYIWRPAAVLLAMAAAYGLGLPMTAVTACLATVFATWVTAVVQLLAIGRRLGRGVAREPARYELKTWVLVSLPILLSEGFYALLTSVDVLMVSYFGSPADAAVYYAATKTLALVHFVYYAVRAATAPRFSGLYHGNDPAALAAMVTTSVRWAFWPSLVLAAVVVALGDRLLALFGADFVGGTGVMAILAAGILARASVGPVESLLTMAGHQMAVAGLFGLAFAVNLALGVWLIPSHGVQGAAIATAVAMASEAAMAAALVRHRFGFSVWILSSGPPRPPRSPTPRTEP